MHKNWFEQFEPVLTELVWTSSCTASLNQFWSSVNQFKGESVTTAQQVWTSLVWSSLCMEIWWQSKLHKNWLEHQFSQPAWMSPWTAHAQPVRTGWAVWTSLNQFPQQVWTSLIQSLHGNRWQSTLCCSCTKTGKNWFEQFEPVLPSSLNWFEPIWTSLNQFQLFSLTIYTTLLMHN